MDLDSVLSRLDGWRHRGGVQYEARCPHHDDRVASLSVAGGTRGGVVLHCHAGCAVEDVLKAIGLTLADVAGEPYLEQVYPYLDAQGQQVYQVERWANPKTFRGYLPPVADRVPYCLPNVITAVRRQRRVFVVEGEKDVESLAAIGEFATCNPGGAGKWLPHFAQWFHGAHLIVVADNNPVGRAHARAVADNLRPVAASLVVQVPRYGTDVSDLLDAGFSINLGLDGLPEEEGLGAVLASNIMPKEIRWAWAGHIPFGKVSIFEGDPGDGKSILTIDLAARWSTGTPMPDGSTHGGPFNVLMITAEDDPEDTIVPRLIAAGADRSRITVVTHGTDERRPFDVEADADELYRQVMKKEIHVVTIDPLMAAVGAGTDTHNDSSVRRALYPMYRVARDLGVAVIAVRHLNKGSGGRAIYRGGGSIAFIGAARCAYTIGRDADDPNRRIMACVKMNIAKEPESLAYSVELGPAGPYIVWHGAVELNAQQVIDGDSRVARNEALEFLNTVVQNGTPMSWKEIATAGKEEGFTEITLRRNRQRSRLIKIVGHDGSRSIRWGYLEHELASHAAEGATPPSAHSTPVALVQGLEHMGVSEQMAAPLTGERQTELDMPDVTDDDRETDIMALPLVCEVCGSDSKVSRYLKPYWAVRCRIHSPLVYKEGGLEN